MVVVSVVGVCWFLVFVLLGVCVCVCVCVFFFFVCVLGVVSCLFAV